MGAYDFLEKPISISKLLSSCEDIFKDSSEKIESEENEKNESNHQHHNARSKVKQRTIAKSIVVSGFALMEGRKTALTLMPAEANTGIVFIDINTNTHIKLSHSNILSKDKSGAGQLYSINIRKQIYKNYRTFFSSASYDGHY